MLLVVAAAVVVVVVVVVVVNFPNSALFPCFASQMALLGLFIERKFFPISMIFHFMLRA